MVVPSPATGSGRRTRRRNQNADILCVIAATVLAVGAAWIVTLSLLKRSSSSSSVGDAKIIRDSFTPPAVGSKESDGGVQDTIGTGGTMHLSAKDMLATKRPYIVYGTAWKKDATADLVLQAVHAGFRFIDTACQPKHYDEPGVGLGWTMAADQLGLAREDLFLQTKFSSVGAQDPENMPYVVHAELEDQVYQSVHASLRNLKTEYIDSLVLHSPMPKMDDTMKVWRALEVLVEEKKIRQLGISNCYDVKVFAKLYKQAKIKPKVLQNRFHERTNFDVELREMCEQFGVQYQSFWTLTANRKALASPRWAAVSEEKGLTPQTLMYAFMMELGHLPLSGTKDAGHMDEDVDVMLRIQRGENILSSVDMSLLSELLGIREKTR